MKLAVFGLGSIGRRHVRNFQTLGCEVVAHDPCPREAVAVPLVSLETALTAEAVVIATPPESHLPLLAQAVQAGAHALVEKPLVWGGAEAAEKVLALAETRRLNVLTGYSWRYWPPLQRMKALLDFGAIGRLRLVRVEYNDHVTLRQPDYRTSFMAGPQGGNLAQHSHAIDLLRWFGGEVVDLTSRVARVSDWDLRCDDVADLFVRFDSGAIGSMTTTMLDWRIKQWVELHGDLGLLAWTRDAQSVIRLYRAETRQWQTWNDEEDLNVMYLNEARHYLDVCAGRAEPICSGWDGLAVVRVMDAARGAR